MNKACSGYSYANFDQFLSTNELCKLSLLIICLSFLNSMFFQCEHSRLWPSVPRLHAMVVNAQIGLRPVGLWEMNGASASDGNML